MPGATYALLGVFIAVVGVLHVADGGDPRFHYVSEYALAHPVGLAVGFAAAAGAGAATALVLWPAAATRRGRAAAILMVLFAVGMLMLAGFATDHEGRAPSTTTAGRLHNVGADLASLSLLCGLLLAWSSFSARALGAFLAAVFVAALLPPAVAPEWFGLHQRIWWATLFAGLALLIRATGRRRAAGAA